MYTFIDKAADEWSYNSYLLRGKFDTNWLEDILGFFTAKVGAWWLKNVWLMKTLNTFTVQSESI